VRADRFPDAVRLACEAGASGFLAGRAVWASVVGSPRLDEDLEQVAVPALQRLVQVVDDIVGR
jgi:sulfofructosephosphate aldolase